MGEHARLGLGERARALVPRRATVAVPKIPATGFSGSAAPSVPHPAAPYLSCTKHVTLGEDSRLGSGLHKARARGFRDRRLRAKKKATPQ